MRVRAYTAEEIQKIQDPEFIVFRMLWKPTCQVQLPPTFAAYRGNFADTLIFSQRNGKCIMRRYVKPRDARTPAQLRKREHMRRIKDAWLALTAKQRDAWCQWAKTYR